MPGAMASASTRPDCHIAVAAAPRPSAAQVNGYDRTPSLVGNFPPSHLFEVVHGQQHGGFIGRWQVQTIGKEAGLEPGVGDGRFQLGSQLLAELRRNLCQRIDAATSRHCPSAHGCLARHMMARPCPDLPRASSCHHPPSPGDRVPMYKLRNGEPGFPFAVSSASKSSWPPVRFPMRRVHRQLPTGASDEAHGGSSVAAKDSKPRVGGLVKDRGPGGRVNEAVSPSPSSSARANLKTIRACSMDAAHRTDSVPGQNKASLGSKFAPQGARPTGICRCLLADSEPQGGSAVPSRRLHEFGLERFKDHDLHKTHPERYLPQQPSTVRQGSPRQIVRVTRRRQGPTGPRRFCAFSLALATCDSSRPGDESDLYAAGHPSHLNIIKITR